MEIIHSLSFRQAVLLAAAVAGTFTALFAWIYMLLNRRKSKREDKEKITSIKPLKSPAAEIASGISSIEAGNNTFLEKIESSISELSLKVDYLENSFKVCSLITDRISAGGITPITEYKKPFFENSIKSKIERLKQKGYKENDIAARLNLSSELKKLYFHVHRQRDKVHVG